MEIKLKGRLETVYNFIPEGARAADVGTDHGYIPARLALEGRAKSVVASDIREAPLSRARLSAAKYGVSDKIDFVLADGLSGLDENSVDCVIIAGMGGETLIKILAAAPWTREVGKTLVLQPQSKGPELCLWLYENGYKVEDAALAADGGKLYLVLKARGGREELSSKAALFAHPRLLANRDPLLPEYLDRLIMKLSRALSGMERARRPGEAAGEKELKTLLSQLRAIKKEAEKWRP